MLCSARKIIFQLLFESIKCRELSDIDGNIVPMDGSNDFDREWEEYQQGFGDRNRDFWLGLDAIHAMTAESVTLRIDLVDLDGKNYVAKYNKFKVGSSESNYILEISGYSGNATDSMNTKHNGMRFSTKDRDNDQNSGSCAMNNYGGWWYISCYDSYLNGLFTTGTGSIGQRKYMSWRTLKGDFGTISFSEMKIRRVV